jgi:hypothetical protein
VVLWNELTVGDIERIQECNGGNVEKMILTLMLTIQEWNLDEQPTLENIKKLPFKDVEHLLSLTSFYIDAKKKAEELEEQNQEKKTNS